MSVCACRRHVNRFIVLSLVGLVLALASFAKVLDSYNLDMASASGCQTGSARSWWLEGQGSQREGFQTIKWLEWDFASSLGCSSVDSLVPVQLGHWKSLHRVRFLTGKTFLDLHSRTWRLRHRTRIMDTSCMLWRRGPQHDYKRFFL